MSLPREDLELIDALVQIGAISRSVAREVAATAKPGRVATLIWERGYPNACGPGILIVERLAKAEAWSEHALEEALEWINKHDFTSQGVKAPPLAYMSPEQTESK